MRLSADLQISVSVALSEAANRGHEFVGLEHLLFALLHDKEAADVIRHCGGDAGRLRKKLEQHLSEQIEVLPEDKRRSPQPTLGFQRVLSRAATHVESAGKQEVQAHNVLIAMYSEPESWAVHYLEQEDISRLDVVSFVSHGVSKLEESRGMVPFDRPLNAECEEEAGEQEGADPLELYAVHLNALAEQGVIDPLIGRSREIQRAMHVLCRRRKNNPLLVGDSGVGKTAIVEGLALKIHQEEVPEAMRGAQIYSLDMGVLLAGTRYRGDFENRMKAVIKRLEEMEHAVLFIDELHTIMGAGSAGSSTMDAANLLKPALSSGKLRCIGSTTYQDYRQHLERDHALMRRFQRLDIREPSQQDAIKILEGLQPRYEAFHQVSYAKSAVRAAVEFSARYLQERKLPDSAIDVIDEAGAAARLAGRKGVRIAQKEVERIVSQMAQVPVKRVSRDDCERLMQLEQDLKAVVFGQDSAIEQISASVKISRAGLGNIDRPVGAFLFTGPTGVGKTELAKQLAETLGLAFLRFDMSEYMERHTVSRLIGAPPGYVGFDQSGLLTDAIRKTPHAVLLLDEIEKAHQDVFNLLLQVMDHGTLTDNNGKKADFRHVILLMTSNVGSRELEKRAVGFGEQSAKERDDEYKRMFSPEFRNRLDSRVRFNALSPAVMGRIVDKFISDLQAQLTRRKVTIELTEAARTLLAEKGYDPQFGARPLGRVIQEQLRRPLSEKVLFGELENGGRVTVDAVDGEIVFKTA